MNIFTKFVYPSLGNRTAHIMLAAADARIPLGHRTSTRNAYRAHFRLYMALAQLAYLLISIEYLVRQDMAHPTILNHVYSIKHCFSPYKGKVMFEIHSN